MTRITCRDCGETKSDDDYSKTRDKPRQPCKACRAQQERTRRLENKLRTLITVPEAKWCNGCERLLTVDAFAVDKSTASGLQSACRACQRQRVQKRDQRIKRIRNGILEYIVCQLQNGECPGCGKGRNVFTERIGKRRIEWVSQYRATDNWYASLIIGWVRKEEFMRDPRNHPKRIAGVVHASETATSLTNWYLKQPQTDTLRAELHERCKELTAVCDRCYGNFLRAAGVLPPR
jgi:hypothetical protein